MFRRRQQFKMGASVGLEIGAAGIRAVEISASGKEAVIQRLASCETPAGSVRAGRLVDPAAVAGALRRLWEEGGFTTRCCHIALPSEALSHQMLTLPPAPPCEQRAIVRGELTRIAPMEASTSFGWMTLAPGGGPGGNTLAFLAEGEVIAGYREALALAGIELSGCEPGAITALRAAQLGTASERAPGAKVRQGAQCAAVVHAADAGSEIAFLEAGRTRYYRRLDQGLATASGPRPGEPAFAGVSGDSDEGAEGAALERFLSSQTLIASLPDAEDRDLEQLALEIKRSLQYDGRAYADSPQPERINLLGECPRLERLADRIREELHLEAEHLWPVGLYRQSGLTGAESTRRGARYTTALGAALRPLADAQAGGALDLKTPDEAQPLVRHAPRYLMASLSGSTVFVCAALGASMLLDARLNQLRDRLGGAEADLQAANIQRAASVAQVRRVRTEINRLRKEALPVPQLLISLGDFVSDGVGLTSIQLKEDGSLALEGDARAPQQVNGLLQRLSFDSRFSTPVLDTLDASADQNRVRFKVQTGLVDCGKQTKK